MKYVEPVRRWSVRALAALGLLFLLVTFTPVTFWWATMLAGPWNDPQGDVLIVMTGSDLDDGILGESSYWRAVYALVFYRERPFSEVLITGGGGQQIPVSASMRDFIVAQGVPAGVVRIESASHSTHESAVNVTRIVQSEPERYRNRRLVLMTSDYHMFRTHRAFQKAGLEVEPRPFPDIRKRYGSRLNRWGLFVELLLENTKIGYYWWQGWI